MASLRERVGPRYRAAVARGVAHPSAGDITPGHPIDPLVAHALTSVDLDTSQVKSTEQAKGPVLVEVHWLGKESPELWNFVQFSPAGATVEDIASALWGDPKQAYTLRLYGDVCRIAPAHARKLLRERYRGEVIGTADTDADAATQVLALARSGRRQGDAAAKEIATGGPAHAAEPGAKNGPADKPIVPTAAQLLEIDLKIGDKLTTIRSQVAAVGHGDDLAPAFTARVARGPLLASGDDKARAQWLPVLQFQHTQLLSIEPLIAPLVAALKPIAFLPASVMEAGARKQRDRVQGELVEVLRAAAVSHLRDESTALLRDVMAKERAASLDRQDAAQEDLEGGIESAVETPAGAPVGSVAAAEDFAHQRQGVLRGQTGAGSRFDQERALTQAGEVALRARMTGAAHSLSALEAAAVAAFGDLDSLHKLLPNVKLLPDVIATVQKHLADVERAWVDARRDAKITPETDPKAPPDWPEWQHRAAGLQGARDAFAKIAEDQSLNDFVREAQRKIKDQQFWNALVSFGKMLLLVAVTAGVGAGASMLGAGAAEALAGEGATLLTRTVAVGVDIGINVTINSAVQLAMSEGPTSIGWTLLENGLMDIFTRGLSRPLRAAEQAAQREAAAIASLPHLADGERAALLAADYSGRGLLTEMVTGMATQWAAHRIVSQFHSQPDAASEPFALTVLQQGAAIGLGKFFHGRYTHWQNYVKELRLLGIASRPEVVGVIQAREAFYALADHLASSPSPDPADAERLLALHENLLAHERDVLGKASDDSAPPRQVGQDAPSAAAHRSSSDASSRGAREATGGAGTHRGEKVTAGLVGVSYAGHGAFRVETPTGAIEVEIRRTSAGEPRLRREGAHTVLEIPKGLTDAQLELAVRAELAKLTENDASPAETHPAGQRQERGALEQIAASPPVLDQVDVATGVKKGPVYESDMEALRQFYGDMEAEAQHGKVNQDHAYDGGYIWKYGNRAFTFSHGVVSFEVRVYLDASYVTPAELHRLKTQVHAGVDHHYNSKTLVVRAPDGTEGQLHIEVIFVEDPASSDIQVVALPGNGRAFVDTWYVEGDITTHAHEVTHGAFGIKDEYVDPSVPDRQEQRSPGVRTDQSIMGDYWVWDPSRGQIADPRAEVKQRHVDEIGKQAPGAPPTPAARAPAQQPAWSGEAAAGETTEAPRGAQRASTPGAPDAPASAPEEARQSRDEFVRNRSEQIHAVETKVGAEAAGVVHEVGALAVDGDWQFEAGQRVGDPLFGGAASTALKRAASAHVGDATASADIKQLGALSRRLQQRMLETLRDPDLDVATRRRELLAVIDQLEAAFKPRESLFPSDADFAGAFRFDEARAAVNDTVDDTFDKKLLMDERGDVYQGQTRIGSFRELMDRVIVTNRALMDAGDPRELVIVDSATPKGKREILVLSRERLPADHERGGTALPVQDHPDPNAVVIDVGSGLSSFALDLLQPADREGGPVMQTEYGPSIVDGSRTRRDLSWEGSVPRTDVDSVTVFGDPMANMDTLFGEESVKRVFINNVNANYSPEQYVHLANVLVRAMADGGRVEVQWTNEPEYKGGEVGSRGHVDGYELLGAVEAQAAAAGRQVTMSDDPPDITPDQGYRYSVRPSTRVDGVLPGKEVPTDPVPTKKVVIVFGAHSTGGAEE